jgi:hypothetical protein
VRGGKPKTHTLAGYLGGSDGGRYLFACGRTSANEERVAKRGEQASCTDCLVRSGAKATLDYSSTIVKAARPS